MVNAAAFLLVLGWFCLAARCSARTGAPADPGRLATLRFSDELLRSVFGDRLFSLRLALAGVPAALVTFVIVLRAQDHSAPWHPLQMRGEEYVAAGASAVAAMVIACLFMVASRALIRRTFARPKSGLVRFMLVFVLAVGALLVPLSMRSNCGWAIGSPLPTFALLLLDGPCISALALAATAGYGGVFPLFFLTLFVLAPATWIVAGAFIVHLVQHTNERAVRRIRTASDANRAALGYAAAMCFLAAAALVVAYPAYVPTPA